MGKRGHRSKRRPSHFERRARQLLPEGGFHRKRANRITNVVIAAAVFTAANQIANAYGGLPYDYFYFQLVQLTILAAFGILGYFIYVWNSRVPVYREAFWMLVVYATVSSWLLGTITV